MIDPEVAKHVDERAFGGAIAVAAFFGLILLGVLWDVLTR